MLPWSSYNFEGISSFRNNYRTNKLQKRRGSDFNEKYDTSKFILKQSSIMRLHHSINELIEKPEKD